METSELQILHAKLEEAFGSLPIPAGNSIVYDNSGNHLECNAIRNKFQGRHWRDFSFKELIGEADSLVFFTPKTFIFFLPAFMLITLFAPEEADNIPDAIISSFIEPDIPMFRYGLDDSRPKSQLEEICNSLLPDLKTVPVKSHANSRRMARLQALTPKQRVAVRDFVRFLKRFRADDFALSDLEKLEATLT